MSGKTRIDQIYPTQELLARTLDIETVVAPFTDHLAVCLRISIALPIMRMGCGLWKMDSAIITENTCTEKMRTLWAQLQRQKGAFSDRTMWWDHLCKRKIRQLFQREQAEHQREHRIMENHLYECIYDVLQQPGPNDKTLPPLNRLKLKIVRLHSIRLQKIFEDNSDAHRAVGEQPTIYHTFQMKRRRAERPIYRLWDAEGRMHTTPGGIVQTLTTFLRKMNNTIEADDGSLKTLMEVVRRDLHTSYGGMLESPLEPAEIHQAIQKMDRKRRQGGWARAWILLPQLGTHMRRPVWYQPNVLGRTHYAEPKMSNSMPAASTWQPNTIGLPSHHAPQLNIQGCIQKFQDSTCKKKFAYLGC